MPPALASPDHYPHSFENGLLVLAAMDRAAYARSLFLDRRISPAADTVSHVPISAVPLPPRVPTTGWIFQVAHCGSTLLARALDRPGGGLVLREPLTLRQLGADAANRRGDSWQPRFELVTALLARRYGPDAMTIIKANVPVNFMLPALVANDPAAPAIFLHFRFIPYLLAILRGPNHRQWVRHVTEELRPGIETLAGALPDDDAGRAAALWLAQLRGFAAAMAQLPNSYSPDAEALFSDPEAVVAAAAAVFEQPMPPADVAAIVGGPLFATYSKNPGLAFDNQARLARIAGLADALAPELASARQWLDKRLATHPLPARLPRALVPGQSPHDLLANETD